MSTVLRVRDWDKNFETHETRKLKHMLWVPMPIKQDGDGYTDLVLSEDGANGVMAGPLRLAAWVAMLQLAGRCSPRGTLWRSIGAGTVAHNAESIARITRIPADLIEDAIPKLIEIGWLERVEMTDADKPVTVSRKSPGEPGEDPGDAVKSSGRREGKGREGMEEKGRDGEPAAGPVLQPSVETAPLARPNKRERLLDLLKRFGCSMNHGSENIFAEWCNVVGDYSIEWIEHLMAVRRLRAHLPSGLRKILKDTHQDWLAWTNTKNLETAQ